jgi:hypothetical protein
MNTSTLPLAEWPARLGWSLARKVIHSEPPGLCICFIPDFPGCNAAIAETGIVWDVLALYDSARRPGGYFLLNSDCGYPPDSYIEEVVFVSHPNADTIVWEIDIRDLRPSLAPHWQDEDNCLRLVFEREQYEADVRSMLREARAASSPDLPVEELEPDVQGLAFEQMCALDCEGQWTREPVLSPGTIVEFGFFGSNVFMIDGNLEWRWPTRLFPRWTVNARFKQWIRFAHRGYALRYALGDDGAIADLSRFSGETEQNKFVLLHESERAACDRAGEELALLLKASFAEGETAPGVEVKYRPCDIPAAAG